MKENQEFLLVKADVLPEVFLKVLQAKMHLAQGKAKNASQASQMAGISRSAFYKYKDSVFHYHERAQENIVTFYLTLEDRPGVLSTLLSELYRMKVNIVTVNQNIPVDGVAIATLAVRATQTGVSSGEILQLLGGLDGVVEAKNV